MKPKIQVILGSIREGRAGEKIAKWFMAAIKDNQSADIELVDLKDYPMPLFTDSDEVRHREGAHPNAVVEKWLQKISQAQGYIFITPEYNHGIPSGLKNAVDYTYKLWNNKALGFVSYGGVAGGARSVEHWRGIAGELQMHDVRDQLIIPMVWAAFDKEGNLTNSEQYAKTANLLVDKVAEAVKKLNA